MTKMKLRYFSEAEFNKLTPSCSLSDMDEDFMDRLDNARHLAGIPFRLSSAFRSRSWDVEKGRSGNSYHCSGKAVDIICRDSYSRAKIIKALIHSGIYGIGIAPTFIHCDKRELPTIFLYDK